MTVKTVLSVIVWGLLLYAAISDLLWQQVYDLVWIVITGIQFFLLLFYRCFTPDIVISLGFFIVIQEFVMDKAYGKADCHALCCCALSYASFRCGLNVYIFHLAVTFILLCVVQFSSGNVDKRLRLKKKIPMIPYILVGYWIVLCICVP
ncbi:MAG: hypothetical protein IJ796_06655 [Lachnospiraceae bacterium]|nr:hypothetical protein [Lachnospiraceae bacterium]